LSKRIEALSKTRSKLFGIVPYVDPKSFENSLNNQKSDIYSVGVILWEISSGHPPFCDESCDFSLALKIIHGHREDIIPDTPKDYVEIYTSK
jgi:serine/threonine protein kinase